MPTERLICPRARIGQAKARRILREKVTPENPIWYVQLIGGGNVLITGLLILDYWFYLGPATNHPFDDWPEFSTHFCMI